MQIHAEGRAAQVRGGLGLIPAIDGEAQQVGGPVDRVEVQPVAADEDAVLRAVEDSFTALPLLSVGVNAGTIELLSGLLNSAMTLAIQLAAPMLITALVVDLVLGFIGKTIPQMNVMAAGLSLRSAVGIMVMIVGMSLSSEVIKDAMGDSIRQITTAWNQPASP